MKKCKDDLTDIFIYLLSDARKNEDEKRFQKLYNSAKRRRAVNVVQIDKALDSLA